MPAMARSCQRTSYARAIHNLKLAVFAMQLLRWFLRHLAIAAVFCSGTGILHAQSPDVDGLPSFEELQLPDVGGMPSFEEVQSPDVGGMPTFEGLQLPDGELYIPPNAEKFACMFEYSRHANAVNKLALRANGIPICPQNGGSYGSHFSGDRRSALDALIRDAGVRKDRIIAMEMLDIQNAGAIICEDDQGRKKQLVMWDPQFLETFDEKAGTGWASVAILAHEIAHHLNNDTGQSPGVIPPHERREQELYADRYAGQKLRQFGATRKEAVAVFHHMGEGGHTHPPSEKRVAAAGQGWDRGRTGMPPDPSPDPGPGPVVTPPMYVASYCQTPIGFCLWNPMTPPIPVGAPCLCPTFRGPIQGIAHR